MTPQLVSKLEESLPNKLSRAIKNIIKTEGYSKFEVRHRKFETDSNFLGILYEVNIKSTTNGKAINLFVKHIIKSPEDIVFVSEAYKRELYFYKNLAEIYYELQEEARIPLEERYRTVKFYSESDSEAIILQNMAKQGYKSGERLNLITLEKAEILIKQLAKFHALSFVLEKARPEYFNANIKQLKLPLNITSHNYVLGLESFTNIAVRNVSEEAGSLMMGYKGRFCMEISRYITGHVSGKRSLCHGDYKPGNILFQEMDGQIRAAIAVDYQMMHYGSPIYDIVYLIFLSTDRQFRKAHLSHVKDFYYITLDKFLRYFNTDAETVYPRADFEKDYKVNLILGYDVAIHYLGLVLVDNWERCPKLEQRHDCQFTIDVHGSYKERMEGIVQDFVEWGYL